MIEVQQTWSVSRFLGWQEYNQVVHASLLVCLGLGCVCGQRQGWRE